MKQDIREQLLVMRESDYQKFSSSLIPGVENMLGIRLPQLRKLAKEIAKSDWKKAIAEEDIYFEERMLRGMVLSYASKDMDEMLPYITAFIPLVDNWSVCDSVFMGMDIFQKDRERTWEYIQPYLQSDREFEVRVALIIMMQHLLKCDAAGKKISRRKNVSLSDLQNKKEAEGLYTGKILSDIDRAYPQGYYASMAASWLIAEAFCTYPYHTMCLLDRKNQLDDVTYNKAMQKIIESRIPDNEVKDLLREMKRK